MDEEKDVFWIKSAEALNQLIQLLPQFETPTGPNLKAVTLYGALKKYQWPDKIGCEDSGSIDMPGLKRTLKMFQKMEKNTFISVFETWRVQFEKEISNAHRPGRMKGENG